MLRAETSSSTTPDEVWSRFRRTGRPEDLGRLFDVTATALFRIALALAVDEASAEDALQETYLTALENGKSHDGTRPVMPWLTGILRRKILRQRRDVARRPDPDRSNRPHAEPDPADAVTDREERRRVRDALDRLPEPYREVALLRWLHGLEPSEIAHLRGEAPGTIRSQLHRAAKRLKTQLGSTPAVVVVTGAGKGLEGMRARLLERAEQMPFAPTESSVPACVASLTGGALVMGTLQKIGIAVAAVLALGAGTYGLWTLTESARDSAAPDALHPEVASSLDDEAPDGRRRPGPSAQNPDDADSGRDAPAPEVPPPVDLSAVDRESDLHGTVVDAEGRPVAGAAIRTASHPHRRANVLTHPGKFEPVAGPETVSSTDGTFVLRLRPGSFVDLTCEAAGFRSVKLRDANAGERLEIELVGADVAPDGVSITVRVADADRRIVAGAAVRAARHYAWKGRAFEATGTTDELGEVVLSGLPPDARCFLSVDAGERGRLPLVDATVAEHRDEPLDIVLPRARTLVGRVTDAADGRPIPDAVVGMGWTQNASVQCDDDGRYSLPGWNGRNVREIAITADGYARGKFVVGERTTIDVRLERGDVVTGILVDVDASPVEGAHVSAMALGVVDGLQRTSFDTCLSADDGSFRLTGLANDLVHTLIVVAEGQGRFLLDFDPHPGGPGEVDLGRVTLPPARTIAGRVTGADDAPMAGVKVVLKGANHGRDRLRGKPSPDLVFYGTTESRRTDDLGRFRFPDLAAGRYTVHVRPDGIAPVSREVVLGNEDVLDLDVAIPVGRRVRIRVLGPAGSPLAGAVVFALGPGRTESAETGADGIAEIPVAPGEPVQIQVTGSNGLPETAVLRESMVHLGPDENEATFRYESGRVVRARLLDPHGDPVASAQVVITSSTGAISYAQTDAEGRFTRAVLSDRLTLRFHGTVTRSAGGSMRVETLPLGVERRDVEPNGEEVELRCVPVAGDRSLTVLVLDPAGRPMSGVGVMLSASGRSNRTDDEGRVHFTDLRAEAITVRLFGPQIIGNVAPSPRDVTPDGQTIELRLRRGARLGGEVVDARGDPVVAARVTIHEGGRRVGSAVTDRTGHFTTTVPADAESLRVTAVWVAAGSTASTEAVLDDVAPGADVRLAPR